MADKDNIANKNKDNLNKNQVAWWQPAIIVFAKLAGWIATPVVVALYLGDWLDEKYNRAPYWLFTCIAIAFFVSMAGLVKETIVEYRKIDLLNKTEKLEKADKNNKV